MPESVERVDSVESVLADAEVRQRPPERSSWYVTAVRGVLHVGSVLAPFAPVVVLGVLSNFSPSTATLGLFLFVAGVVTSFGVVCKGGGWTSFVKRVVGPRIGSGVFENLLVRLRSGERELKDLGAPCTVRREVRRQRRRAYGLAGAEGVSSRSPENVAVVASLRSDVAALVLMVEELVADARLVVREREAVKAQQVAERVERAARLPERRVDTSKLEVVVEEGRLRRLAEAEVRGTQDQLKE